jgi:hypothetical protein
MNILQHQTSEDQRRMDNAISMGRELYDFGWLSISSAGGSFEAVKVAGAARTLDIQGSDPVYHPPERRLLGL